MIPSRKAVLTLAAALTLSACARDADTETTAKVAANRSLLSAPVRVISARETLIMGEADVGFMPGALVGGLAGSFVGEGAGRMAATFAGGLAGAVATGMVAAAFGSERGVEYLVELPDGLRVTIVQPGPVEFQPGEIATLQRESRSGWTRVTARR